MWPFDSFVMIRIWSYPVLYIAYTNVYGIESLFWEVAILLFEGEDRYKLIIMKTL